MRKCFRRNTGHEGIPEYLRANCGNIFFFGNSGCEEKLLPILAPNNQLIEDGEEHLNPEPRGANYILMI